MKRVKTVCLLLVGLVGLAVVCNWALTDSEGQPYCHKVFDLGAHNWQDARKTQAFPNVNGDSAASLAVLMPYLEQDWSERYHYVPGLRRDDPGDLVLLYLPQPTRWIWHGQRPSIFAEKAWLIAPVDMTLYSADRNAAAGEFSERLSWVEFQQRLKKTLSFLEEEQRPHWEAAVEQHSKFLDSMVTTE